MDTLKIGYLELSFPITDRVLIFSGECAGKIFKTKYKNNVFQIHMPNFKKTTPNSNHKPTLEDTELEMNWLSSLDLLEAPSVIKWHENGEIYIFNSKYIFIRSDDKISEDKAKEIMQILPEWSSLFINWLEILDFRSFTKAKNTSVTNPLSGYLLSDTETSPIRTGIHSMEIQVESYKGLNNITIGEALRLTELNVAIPQYYTYLISALKNFNRKNFRNCILDSATAFELSLISLKDEYYKNNNIPESIKKSVNNKFQNVSQTTSLLSLLYCKQTNLIQSLHPSEYEKITKIRNKAIHEGQEITQEEASVGLFYVKNFIYAHKSIN